MSYYNLKVIRSARRSVSLKIVDGNTLEVRAPLHMTMQKINEFVNSKQSWIARTIRKQEQNEAFFEGVSDYKFVLINGVRVPLTIGGKLNYSYDGVTVKSLKDIKTVCRALVEEEFTAAFDEIVAKYGFNNIPPYKLRDYKSRWGCCDTRRQITFNYKLFMLHERLWRYVIVHELCHTVYMNHSRAFYALVGKIMPEYKSVVKELKKYSSLTRLY